MGQGIYAAPPVFVLADPDDEPLSREISWMAIDAFEALVAAYPDGPSVENVRDMWRNLLRGIDRRIAEARLLEAEEAEENAAHLSPVMRVAGLIMSRVAEVPTWIAFSSGAMKIYGHDGEEIPMRDDVGWDMPGYLWAIPMEEGQRFALLSDSLHQAIGHGRIQSVLSNLVRAERAAPALLTSAALGDTANAAALVVDVVKPDVFASLSDAATMMVEDEDETDGLGEFEGESGLGQETPGNWGLQLLGITRTRDDGTIRRATAPPPEIEGFRFVSYLGSGGFSDVYLYEEELPRRMVAIKVLARRALGAKDTTRFDDEVNIMAQLSDHPSIVTIYSASITGANHPYIAMQYCPLPSLSERISDRTMSLEEALSMGVDISSAVHTAHLLGIHHHDLKPSNVLYSSFGRPLLSDFGIATLSITSGEDVMGASIPWAPPEVLDGQLSGRRSDVFSLAATVFTAVTGKPPYGNIRREGELPHYEWLEEPLLEPIFRDALEADPMLRTATAYDFAQNLREAQKALGFDMTPIEVPREA
ncbi:MAG: serine/threonine protein kinase [Actinomycetaceae bacterium]|nr:serine/threonine protein kinase [Actinomycetaceae bacterium]